MNKTDAKSLCCTEFDDDDKHDPIILSFFIQTTRWQH